MSKPSSKRKRGTRKGSNGQVKGKYTPPQYKCAEHGQVAGYFTDDSGDEDSGPYCMECMRLYWREIIKENVNRAEAINAD